MNVSIKPNINEFHNKRMVSSDKQQEFVVKNTPSFCGRTDGLFFNSTLKNIDNIYKSYAESLLIPSLKDLNLSVSNIMKATNSSKKEVLSTMQLLTQFAEIRNIDIIDKVLKSHKVEWIGNQKGFLSKYLSSKLDLDKNAEDLVCNSDLHDALEYLLVNKKLCRERNVKGEKIAIILDEDMISQMETLRGLEPENYKKIIRDNRLKFFHISGWDTGITFFNREKNLDEDCINLINRSRKSQRSVEDELDFEQRKRIASLGISPISIKNEGLATFSTVYNQLKPEMMTKNELTNLIEANVDAQLQTNLLSVNDLLDAKDYMVSITGSSMQIYSSALLSRKLQLLHKNIMKHVKDVGKSENDVIFLRINNAKNESKSDALIMYSYKKINNIPNSKIVNLNNLGQNQVSFNNKIVVIPDDCSITGATIMDIINKPALKKIGNNADEIIFANVVGSKYAYSILSDEIKDKNIKILFLDDYETLNFNKYNGKVQDLLGRSFFNCKNMSCIAFPYMSPDNNYRFAVNISMFHNPNFRRSNFSPSGYRIRGDGVKNISAGTISTTRNFIEKIGQDIKVYDSAKVFEPVPVKKTKSIWENLKSKIFGC